MKRRNFLQAAGTAGVALPLAFGSAKMRAFGSAPNYSMFSRMAETFDDRIFVIVRFFGGNDGLNTLVPFTNPDYYTARATGNLAIPANQVVKFKGSSTLGLHPGLAALKPLFDEDKVCVVQNVAYEKQSLSHFRSSDIWLTASDASAFQTSGWFARYLEQQYPNYPQELPEHPFAIEIGNFLSATLVGEQNNMGIAMSDLSYIPDLPGNDPLAQTNAGLEEEYVKTILKQTNIFSNAVLEAVLRQPTNKVTYPEPTQNPLSPVFSVIARAIAGGLKSKLFIINTSGYDTHTGQLAAQAALHTQFANAVVAFQRDMEAFGLDQKVCVGTISEFGRRVESNGTGTDHGKAAPLFVIGTNVIGGVIGNDPDLSNLDPNGNLQMQYDFRQVYASILGQWFGAKESDISPKALPRKFEQLPIFKVSPTSVHTDSEMDSVMYLGQNVPNPAMAETVVTFDGVLTGATADLRVYTSDGKLVEKHKVMPGQTTVKLNVQKYPSGSYQYVLRAGSVVRTRTMVVVR